MKTFTKIGSVLIALVMTIVLGFTAVPASADDETYTITISNAQAGTTYSAYKIFDAVSGTTTDGEEVSYYTLDKGTDNGNAIYTYMIGDENCLFTFYESGTTDIYYVQTNDGATTDDLVDYLKTMVQDLAGSLTVAASVDNTDSTTVTLDVEEAGYYFVTTNSDNAAVMLTTANPTATIIDKEVVPGNVTKTISKAEIEGSIGGEDHDATEAIGDFVDFTITANVPLYDAAVSGAQEGRLVTKYVFTDTMDEGLEIRGLEQDQDYTVVYDEEQNASYYATKDLLDSWIKITDETTGETYALTDVAYDISMELIGTECTYLDENGKEVTGIVFTGFTLTYYTYDMSEYNSEETPNLATAAEIETYYPANASIAINYEVYVSEEASYENDNTITMNWYMTTFAEPFGPSNGSDEDHPNRPYFPPRTPKNTPEKPGDYEPDDEPDDEPEYPEPFTGTDNDKDEVYVLKLDINKIDGETSESLEGAEFELTGTNLKEIVITTTTTDDGTTDYEYGEKEADGYSVTGTTNADGELEFSGLTIGEWTLKETKAPDGYNLVSSEYTISISVTWTKDETTGIYEPKWDVTVTDANGETIENAFNDSDGIISLTVENYKGSLLPGTGGVGTTVFYVVGICLIVGAGVLLVTRKRVNRG